MNISSHTQYELKPEYWVGVCLCTESDRPEEWPYIANVIRNRLDSGRFQHTYEAIILKPYQFSAFNRYTVSSFNREGEKSSPLVSPIGILRQIARGFTYVEMVYNAIDVARDIIYQTDRSKLPIPSLDVCHYYSPISMIPRGSAPKWAQSVVGKDKLFTPPGIDPQRLVLAEGIA